MFYIEHDVFGHHLEDSVHAGDVIQGIYALIGIGRVGPTRRMGSSHIIWRTVCMLVMLFRAYMP